MDETTLNHFSNVHFVAHDAAGNIIRYGNCHKNDLPLQVPPTGCTILAGEGTFNRHYVLNGEIVAYTDAEITAKNSLAEGFIWKMPERIAVDTRGLDDAKAQAWERIKQARAALEAAPFEWDGSVFQSDYVRIPASFSLAMLAQLSGAPFVREWTLEDNTKRTLDAAGMIAVGIALGNKVGSIFDIGTLLRDQIAASTSIPELDAIHWP